MERFAFERKGNLGDWLPFDQSKCKTFSNTVMPFFFFFSFAEWEGVGFFLVFVSFCCFCGVF